MATYKVTKEFKNCIREMLERRAEKDPKLAEKLHADDGKKSIEECCEYIVGRAYEKKINAATPQEVEGWAVHYYDEESVKITAAPSNSRVVVPVTDEEVAKALAELSVEERAKIEREATNRLIEQQKKELEKSIRIRRRKLESMVKLDTPEDRAKFVELTLF